ncbi:MAG: hypothetical protein IJX53_03210 [Clostridia bacterium]|nr:hypothetical protein [Clostridia bacterium]
MRTRYDIQCTAHAPESGREAFPARIPGNLQADSLAAYPDFCPDLQYADSYKAFIPTEDWIWTYTATPARRFTVCLVADVNGTAVENRYTFALEAERIDHHV